MIPANLIVNADDFGLDPRVSLAIAQCLDEGLINSFSVFPFADAFHDRLLREVLARHPGARVGAHLSMVSPAAGFREGKDHFREFLGRYLTGRYPSARVRREWKDQIEFVGRYLGGPDRLAHLDSHQHLHLMPGLWLAARSLQ
ncbi:MAG: ChbG/HpnK family deacetylase [Fibrobacterota bacterium]|nr:ChbG/HpnK family deacetylase [Fibrobacterota bacterium]